MNGPAGALTEPGVRRDGFVVLPALLSRQELARARDGVDALLAGPLPPGCERPHNTLAPLRWSDELVDSLLADERRVARIAKAAGACDLRWISAYVSVKAPGSGALWWHQDWWCWDHPISYRPAPAQLALLCYLSATAPANGALRVLPGSHRRSLDLHAVLPEAHTLDTGELGAEHPAMGDHLDQVTLELSAGDAVLLDYRLLHGTHANPGPERRDSLLFSFTPDWRGLPEDVRAHLRRHPALPSRSDSAAGSVAWASLLPDFDGELADLPLNRCAPASFAVDPGA